MLASWFKVITNHARQATRISHCNNRYGAERRFTLACTKIHSNWYSLCCMDRHRGYRDLAGRDYLFRRFRKSVEDDFGNAHYCGDCWIENCELKFNHVVVVNSHHRFNPHISCGAIGIQSLRDFLIVRQPRRCLTIKKIILYFHNFRSSPLHPPP